MAAFILHRSKWVAMQKSTSAEPRPQTAVISGRGVVTATRAAPHVVSTASDRNRRSPMSLGRALACTRDTTIRGSECD